VVLGGLDLEVADAVVAEGGAVEQRVERRQQRPVGPPVGPQGLLVVGGIRRGQVGLHVGAAERVDRLLGVADQHERRVLVAERPAQDVPLDRVGVLELVDQRDLVAVAQGRDHLVALLG
jgi:hypothetical protein